MMNKKILSVLVLAVVLLLVWLSRAVLVRSAANLYLSAYDVQLNCFDFNISPKLNIDVSQLCGAHPAVKFNANNVVWNRSKNRLQIGRAELTLQNTSQSGTSSALDLTVPKGLPTISIKELQISAPWLRQPLHLNVQQRSAQRIEIGGDIKAVVNIQDGQLQGSLTWTLQDLADISDVLPVEKVDQALLSQPIQTRFSFDGQTISASSQLDVSQHLEVQQCPLLVSGKGRIELSADWVKQTASVDLSQLVVRGKWPQCDRLASLPAAYRPTEMELSMPEPLVIDGNRLSVEAISLQAKGMATQGVTAQLQLSHLQFPFDAQPNSRYQIQVISPDQLSFNSVGEIKVSSPGFSVTSDDNKLQVSRVDNAPWTMQQLNAQFNFSVSPDGQIHLRGRSTIDSIQQQEMRLTDINTQWQLSGADINRLQLELQNDIGLLVFQAARLDQLTSQLRLNINELNHIDLSGESHLDGMAYADKPLGAIQVEHQLTADLPHQKVTSQHRVMLESGLFAELTSHNLQLRLSVDHQPLSGLSAVAKQWLPEVALHDGQVSSTISADLQKMRASGNFQIDQLVMNYDDIVITAASYESEFDIDSAKLQLSPAKLQIQQVDSGVILSDLQATVQSDNNSLIAKDIEGSMFDGQFFIDQFWLDGRDQQAMLTLSRIDTAKVLDLQKQSGIQVTGLVGGTLPVSLQGGQFSIHDGELSNQGEGKLLINDNQAFNALKAQQPALEQQLALLEHLQIESLVSSVELAPNGLLTMDIAMQGYNPLQKEKVNFNYGHEENILVLLKAIRLTDSLTRKIEQSVNRSDE